MSQEKTGLAGLFDGLKQKMSREAKIPANVTIRSEFGGEFIVHPDSYVFSEDQTKRFNEIANKKPNQTVIVNYDDPGDKWRTKTDSISVFLGKPQGNRDVSTVIDQGKVYIYPTYLRYLGEDGEELQSKLPVLAMTVHGSYITNENKQHTHVGAVQVRKRAGAVTLTDEKDIPTVRLYQTIQAHLRNLGLPNIAFLNSCDENLNGNNIDYDKRWDQYPSSPEQTVLGVGGDLNWIDIEKKGEKTITNIDVNKWAQDLEIRDALQTGSSGEHRYVHSFGKDRPTRPLVDALFEPVKRQSFWKQLHLGKKRGPNN